MAAAMRLTPKQAYYMLADYGKERNEMFSAVCRLLGAKQVNNKDDMDIDTTELDKVSEKHMRELSRGR